MSEQHRPLQAQEQPRRRASLTLEERAYAKRAGISIKRYAAMKSVRNIDDYEREVARLGQADDGGA